MLASSGASNLGYTPNNALFLLLLTCTRIVIQSERSKLCFSIGQSDTSFSFLNKLDVPLMDAEIIHNPHLYPLYSTVFIESVLKYR